jgi:hypothetical protein
MKKIRQIDATRRVIYAKHKRIKADEEQEIAYSEYDGYEIITTHIFGKGYETYKTFGKCGLEVLEKYTNKIDAVAGHIRWCMEGELC